MGNPTTRRIFLVLSSCPMSHATQHRFVPARAPALRPHHRTRVVSCRASAMTPKGEARPERREPLPIATRACMPVCHKCKPSNKASPYNTAPPPAHRHAVPPAVHRANDDDKRALIDKCKCFIFDCDGVIWRGDSVIDGVPETLDLLRSKVCTWSPIHYTCARTDTHNDSVTHT